MTEDYRKTLFSYLKGSLSLEDGQNNIIIKKYEQLELTILRSKKQILHWNKEEKQSVY